MYSNPPPVLDEPKKSPPLYTYQATPPTSQRCECCSELMHDVIVNIREDGRDYADCIVFLFQHRGQRIVVVNTYFMTEESPERVGQDLLVSQRLEFSKLDGKPEFVLCDCVGQSYSPSAFRGLSKKEAKAHLDVVRRVNELILASDKYIVPFVQGMWPPAPVSAEKQASKSKAS